MIRVNLKENWAALEALFPSEGKKTHTSFEQFTSEFVRPVKDPKARLARKELIHRYREWCKGNNLEPMDPRKISQVIRQLDWQSVYSNSETVLYRGVVLVGESETEE